MLFLSCLMVVSDEAGNAKGTRRRWDQPPERCTRLGMRLKEEFLAHRVATKSGHLIQQLQDRIHPAWFLGSWWKFHKWLTLPLTLAHFPRKAQEKQCSGKDCHPCLRPHKGWVGGLLSNRLKLGLELKRKAGWPCMARVSDSIKDKDGVLTGMKAINASEDRSLTRRRGKSGSMLGQGYLLLSSSSPVDWAAEGTLIGSASKGRRRWHLIN